MRNYFGKIQKRTIMKKYITTPIYYVNAKPHVGHAYTSIAADVLTRYWRKQGDEVFFLTGTDEHGAKIAEAAEGAGMDPKDFVDSLVPQFKAILESCEVEYSEFIRTTDSKHEEEVVRFVQRLIESGNVEKKSYTGLYCVGCERFLLPDELKDGKCPDHNRVPEEKSEENYFFKLSNFGDILIEKIESGELEILPEQRKNEVLGKINQGLTDVSISRGEVKWGIPFPNDPSQTIYVWVDALINYYSATKMYQNPPKWPADLHLMAKDILWFHAVIWPAMLIAIGEAVPKKVFAHGFFTVDGKKMSKSLGNVLDPALLAEKFGSDAVRYSLLREFPFGEDGDISIEKIKLRYDSELCNGIGNLVQRTLSMINRYELTEKTREAIKNLEKSDILIEKIEESERNFDEKMEKLRFDHCLEGINSIVTELNGFIEREKPWVLAKEGESEKLFSTLYYVFLKLSVVLKLIDPFMPKTAKVLSLQLESFEPKPLFPRLEN